MRRAEVRRAVERLGGYGEWPLSEAPLAVTADGGRPRIVLRERDGVYALGARGWQRMTAPPPLEDVRVRFRRVPR